MPLTLDALILGIVPFNSETGRRALYQKSGRKRALFWASTGFANLVLARAERARRRALALEAVERSSFSPFPIPGDTPSMTPRKATKRSINTS